MIASASGKFKISTDYSFNKFKDLNTNLNELDVFQVVDIAKLEDDIFVSFIIKSEKEDCIFFGIANANINNENLLFDLFYKENQCTKETNGLGGRIYPYIFKEKNGFLLTTAATDKMKKKSQDLESFFGKIWFFELATKNKILFSVGHRNPQGLIVSDNIVISTEHGPYGGDEINNIKFGKKIMDTQYHHMANCINSKKIKKNIKYQNMNYQNHIQIIILKSQFFHLCLQLVFQR